MLRPCQRLEKCRILHNMQDLGVRLPSMPWEGLPSKMQLCCRHKLYQFRVRQQLGSRSVKPPSQWQVRGGDGRFRCLCHAEQRGSGNPTRHTGQEDEPPPPQLSGIMSPGAGIVVKGTPKRRRNLGQSYPPISCHTRSPVSCKPHPASSNTPPSSCSTPIRTGKEVRPQEGVRGWADLGPPPRQAPLHRRGQ